MIDIDRIRQISNASLQNPSTTFFYVYACIEMQELITFTGRFLVGYSRLCSQPLVTQAELDFTDSARPFPIVFEFILKTRRWKQGDRTILITRELYV